MSLCVTAGVLIHMLWMGKVKPLTILHWAQILMTLMSLISCQTQMLNTFKRVYIKTWTEIEAVPLVWNETRVSVLCNYVSKFCAHRSPLKDTATCALRALDVACCGLQDSWGLHVRILYWSIMLGWSFMLDFGGQMHWRVAVFLCCKAVFSLSFIVFF